MITIVIVDDHPATRDGLKARIAIEPDLYVCGEAEDMDTALQLLTEQRPHIAIVDVSLKTGNGIELVKLAHAQKCKTRMLVWSMYDEQVYAERALRAGAVGYVHKREASDHLITAIRTVRRGEIYLSPSMKNAMLHRVVQGKKTEAQQRADSLSDRELQTFELIGRGFNTAAIARQMQLSPKTIEAYRASLKEKLGVDDMPALIRHAVKWMIENS
ncbi:response regulator transcription factor [Roseimaritima ulvae]|uniref:Oxygen regulatory protein NreC n=1 Tax=Roseimaritima ulvae TaxID=980254 RepID=A0A5B9R2M8_9BACT|nr:response regulator transcription factor [Roseimaritima ulvae]QEG40563.1 Oxygen regulatory protein NreC [Roseimaritima ulvae]